MAKNYRLGPLRRIINRAGTALARTRLGPPNYAVLTVEGRRTGLPRSTPVRPIEYDGSWYLVAPYGPVNWVRNLRASGHAVLTRRGQDRSIVVTELPPQGNGEILRAYTRAVPVTRPYFDADQNDPAERFAAEAAAHPVFRIE